MPHRLLLGGLEGLAGFAVLVGLVWHNGFSRRPLKSWTPSGHDAKLVLFCDAAQVTYNTLIDALVRQGDMDGASAVFKESVQWLRKFA